MIRRAAALWGPVAVVAAVIFALSSIPSPAVPGGAPDWLLHGLEYGALGLVLTRALAGGLGSRPGMAAVGLAVLLGLAYGVTDEWHQSFVPGRTPQARDLAADAAGSLAGALAAAGAARLRPARAQEALRLTLVTGPGCALCDEARHALSRLGRRFALEIEEISVAESADLKARFGNDIPVILADGRKIAKGRIHEDRLAASLAVRTRRQA